MAAHTLSWMEARGVETNGHGDPDQKSKDFIQFFLNDLERPGAQAPGFVHMAGFTVSA